MAIENLPLFSAMNREEVKPPFPHPHRPLTSQEAHFAIMEKVNACIAEVNHFEQRVRYEMEQFIAKTETENTGFKEAIQASYNAFMETVQREVNNFETDIQNNFDLYRNDIDKRVADFQTAINKEFETLQTNVVKASDDKIAELEELRVKMNENFTTHRNEVQALYNAFTTNVNQHMEEQDGKIEEYKNFMVDNILDSTETIFNKKANNGEISALMKAVYGDSRSFKGSLTYAEITALTDANNGDYYYCTDDEHYYQKTTSAWVDIGTGDSTLNNLIAFQTFTTKENEDIKTDATGKKYGSAGKSVRSQIANARRGKWFFSNTGRNALVKISYNEGVRTITIDFGGSDVDPVGLNVDGVNYNLFGVHTCSIADPTGNIIVWYDSKTSKIVAKRYDETPDETFIFMCALACKYGDNSKLFSIDADFPILDAKNRNIFAYIKEGGKVEILPDKSIKLYGDVIIRCENKVIEIPLADIINVANSSELTNVDENHYISGNAYRISVSLSDGNVYIKNSSDLIELNEIILFIKHYNSAISGLMVDYLNTLNSVKYVNENKPISKNIFAYLDSGAKFEILKNKSIKFYNDVIIRYIDDNITIPVNTILDVANASVLTTVSDDNYISGTNYRISVSLKDKSVSIKMSNELLSNDEIVLFLKHYNSAISGLMVDYVNSGISIDVANVANTVEQIIENNVFSSYPTYYEEHIERTIEKINANMAEVGKNGETFAFITDIHWDNNNKHSPALMRRIFNKTNVGAIMCGGDIINEGSAELMKEALIESIHAFNVDNNTFHTVFGNHDNNRNNGNPESEWFSDNAVYSYLFKQMKDVTYFNDFEFYYDIETTKTRFICLNTGMYGFYENERFMRLCEVLKSTPNGYHIILIAHWLYDNGVKTSSCEVFESLIDKYNSNQPVTFNDVEYVFADNTAKIIYMHGGHHHKDASWKTPNGTPVILTDSDNGVRSGNEDFPYIEGTITEQCFDVVTINYTDNTIKMVRVGRGKDRTFTQ